MHYEVPPPPACYGLFHSHMLFSTAGILPRNVDVPVWGWGEPGKEVRISFGEHQVNAVTGADRRWCAWLPPMAACTEGRTLVIQHGDECREFEDVLVGDVWLASGQSNMQWENSVSLHFEETMAQADNPCIRLYGVARVPALHPQPQVFSKWERACPETVAHFSAVAWHFVRGNHAVTGIPQGVVDTSVGGAHIEAYLDPAWWADYPDADSFGQMCRDNFAGMRNYSRAHNWGGGAAETMQRLQEMGYPAQGAGPQPAHPFPGGYWFGMTQPLMPFPFNGFLWYQGESNAWTPTHYDWALRELVRRYRQCFGARDFPFFNVQLAPYSPEGETGRDGWLNIQAIQAANPGIPNSFTASTIDVGNKSDIHPQEKREVGKRLSLLAQRHHYGQKVIAEGPRPQTVFVQGERIVTDFAPETGPIVVPEDGRHGLSVVDAQGRSHSLPDVKQESPVRLSAPLPCSDAAELRHGWYRWPDDAYLRNEAGLPACVGRYAIRSSG